MSKTKFYNLYTARRKVSFSFSVVWISFIKEDVKMSTVEETPNHKFLRQCKKNHKRSIKTSRMNKNVTQHCIFILFLFEHIKNTVPQKIGIRFFFFFLTHCYCKSFGMTFRIQMCQTLQSSFILWRHSPMAVP